MRLTLAGGNVELDGAGYCATLARPNRTIWAEPMSSDGTDAALPVPTSQQSGQLTHTEAGDVYHQIVKTQERYRTARAGIIAGTVLGGIYMVTSTITRVLDQPAWLQALAILIGAGGPSWLMWRMRAKFQVYMQHDHQRTIQLEAAVDVGRASSNIKPDGTSLHD